MGLSRRKLTREMKLAEIRQLGKGSSAAEVARAFEINSNLLHLCPGGGRSSGTVRATPFPAKGSGGGTKRSSLSWSARWDSRRWRLMFLVRQKKSWVDSGSGNLPSE